MRTTVLLFLLLAACASPTAVIDQRSFRCGPGQDIEIRAGVLDPTDSRLATGPLTYIVEIANNSHNDLTVKSIRLDPQGERSTMLTSVAREVDQLIPEGEDHVFEIPTDVWLRAVDLEPVLARERFEFSAAVRLTNGDVYRCSFAMLAKR